MKYTKVAVLILFVFGYIDSFSQYKKIVISDSYDKSSLPYATVKILNANRGYFTDKNGTINIPDLEMDSLMIEYSGYVTGIFVVKDIKDTILLNRKEVELLSIEIKDTRVKKKVGSFKYKKSGQFILGESIEYATKIDLSEIKGKYKIQQIYLPLEINKKTFKDCVVKLHIYNEGENGRPGEDLLLKPIFIQNDSFIDNDFYIDISSQKLIRSERYLFLGIECIMDKVTNLRKQGLSEKKEFNQVSKLSPINFYFSKEKQFFSGGYGHKFTRFLNSSSYSWSSNTFDNDPINIAGGLVVLCNQDVSN